MKDFSKKRKITFTVMNFGDLQAFFLFLVLLFLAGAKISSNFQIILPTLSGDKQFAFHRKVVIRREQVLENYFSPINIIQSIFKIVRLTPSILTWCTSKCIPLF